MDIEKTAEENEKFVGTKWNSEKEMRYILLKDHAQHIAYRDPRVVATYSGTDKTSRHAYVQLTVPNPWAFVDDKSVLSDTASMFFSADSYTVTYCKSGHIKMTFTVENVWED